MASSSHRAPLHRAGSKLRSATGIHHAHCPRQNGVVKSVIWTLKNQCVHRQRFERSDHAMRAIGDGISFYTNRRPNQALNTKNFRSDICISGLTYPDPARRYICS